MAMKNLENKEYTNSVTEEILEPFRQEESLLELNVKSGNTEMDENIEERDNSDIDKNTLSDNNEDMENDGESAEKTSENPKKLFNKLYKNLKHKKLEYKDSIEVGGTKYWNNKMYVQEDGPYKIIYIEFSKKEKGEKLKREFKYNETDNIYVLSDGRKISGDQAEEILPYLKRIEDRYNALVSILKTNGKYRKKYDRKRRVFNI